MSVTTVAVLVVSGTSAGLFIGYLLGRLTRSVMEIEKRVTDHINENGEAPDKSRRFRLSALHIIAVGVVVTGLVTALIGVNVTRNQDRIVGCVAGYSNASAAAFKQRSAAQSVVNEQLDGFMQAVLDAFSTAPADGREKIRLSVESFVEARQEQARVQRENPLPEAPENACAELLD